MEATVIRKRIISQLVMNWNLRQNDYISATEWTSIRNAYKAIFTNEDWEAIVKEVEDIVKTKI